VEAFENRSPKSAKMHREAEKVLPGGDTRTAVFFEPYPLYLAYGDGCKIYDVDGNSYLDFLNNYTALIHGHAYPPIVKAVQSEASKGTCYAAPTESQIVLANIICEAAKSVDQIRFCNSGTEATMNAIRAARLISGKTKVVKVEGGYHGTHDLAEASSGSLANDSEFKEHLPSTLSKDGIPATVLEEIVLIPFNNREAGERIIKACSNKIACVIVEPMLGAGGCLVQEDHFLSFLRDLTRNLGIVLIFDEVVTFRLHRNAAQGLYGIEPDLTTFGKIIGGGLPGGAFGGSKEIMRVYSPKGKGVIAQSGTFNGNPLTMAAGIACLSALSSELLENINSLGEILRRGIDRAFERTGIKGKATGIGSLCWPHFNSGSVRDYRSAKNDNFQIMELVHLALLRKGINIPKRGGELSISTVMTEKEIKIFLTVFEETLFEFKDVIEETAPELVV
jgi:glutamate-1-semialdehyde 2,1-aminomutase